jgi:CBS domain-containing protein/sporulation protein YlmC with PRC-barrel domain
MTTPAAAPKPSVESRPPGPDYQLHYFSELLGRRVCAAKINNVLGRLTDIVFRPSEPYPEIVGIFIDHGWGKPTEFIPWDREYKVDPDAVFVLPPPGGADRYPPFVPQPGMIFVNEHLMGKTIIDTDGRRVEVVNDVQFLESGPRMVLVHVDLSFNGFLRKWHLGWIHLLKNRFISWKYVQPLSVEQAASADTMALSVARRQIGELPSEDLADALEQLSGAEQQAVFSSLEPDKAAATLVEAEPRAQRQIVAGLRKERAQTILTRMSVMQLAELFSVLPHEHQQDLMALLPKKLSTRLAKILSEREVTASTLVSSRFVDMPKETVVAEAVRKLREMRPEPRAMSYIYVVAGDEKTLIGVVDIRDLVLADEKLALADLMISPVVSADDSDTREDLVELFDKYHFRMIPVVDAKDHLLGSIHHEDIMKGE